MSRALSPSSKQPYGVARVVGVWGLARSSYYAAAKRRRAPQAAGKRGPRNISDEALLLQIRDVISQTVFHGEGYRKVWARLRHRGVRVWKERVLRLMRANNLLSPSRQSEPQPAYQHEGSIIAERPDQVWGTDATSVDTTRDGKVTVFAAIDHYTAECLGIHAVRRADRFEALEPLRLAIKERFGSFSENAAAGIRLRHDHGSVYMSDDFQNEIQFLGMESSPSFVRQPEGNGCIERFFRTLKEQLLWIHQFSTVEQVRQAVSSFRENYNSQWLIGRLGYKTPAQARAESCLEFAKAA